MIGSLSGEEVLNQCREFQMLNPSQVGDGFGCRSLRRPFAFLYEGEGIQGSREGQSFQYGLCLGSLCGPDGCGRCGPIDRVPRNPAKPVRGIPVVGFAPVQKGVNQAAIAISAVLDQIVCRVMVVVVQQCGCLTFALAS